MGISGERDFGNMKFWEMVISGKWDFGKWDFGK